MKNFWQMTIEELTAVFSTDAAKGISNEQAKERLLKSGKNQLKEKKGPHPIVLFFAQFNDFIVWILIVAAVVSGALGEWIDSAVIIAIVILNAALGFIQEYRAEKSLEALKKLSSPTSRVFRSGSLSVIPSDEIVTGDLVELEAGDNIPSDCRIVYVTPNFATMEASLTGESTPVAKDTVLLDKEDVPLAERINMLYLGTTVVSGKARAVIVATGMNTELGKIAGMIQDIGHEMTPLQKKLEEFGRYIVFACGAIVILVFGLGVWRGGKIIDMFMTSVSLAVAAIPEGLPAIVTIALALGVQRMVKRNVLIRKLHAVETLGCANVICSDKTGTLTRNEMTVKKLFVNGKIVDVTGVGYEPKGEFYNLQEKINITDHPDLAKTLTSAVLCNSANLVEKNGVYSIVGDPTEGALIVCAHKIGVSKKDIDKEHTLMHEIPFDSVRKKMTVVYKGLSGTAAHIKGAPELVLNECTSIEENGQNRPITEDDRKKILKANDEFSNSALRVLSIAYKNFEGNTGSLAPEEIERNMTFLGLIAMIDPPREEVKVAVKQCKTSGIRTVMITGDHKNTAVAIAKELGFFSEDSLALTGEELDKLSDAELSEKVSRVSVYARVSPENKLRIVRAWRKNGAVVSMTGDGVNDAPAVKEADIGVAMGITGTDVTKQVSDMVITDDNFASIVAAIEEGRGIYDNIRKFVHFLISCNIGEVLVMFVSTLVGLPMPLLPVQILWVNLVTDGLPAIALGMDPVDKNIMQRPPSPVKEAVITKQRSIIMLFQGAFIAFASLLAFCLVYFVEKEGIEMARTAAFTVLACAQLFHAFNCRHMTDSIFKVGFFSNPKLIWAALFSFGMQMLVVYLPVMQKMFKTEPLGLIDWIMVIVISSSTLWGMEIIKLIIGLKRKLKNAD